MEDQILPYIKFTDKPIKMRRYALFGIILFVLMGCKPLPKEGETVVIEGNILWVGSEPFARRVIMVKDKSVYLEIPNSLDPFFKEHSQKPVHLEGTFHYEKSGYVLRVYKADLVK